MEERVIQACHEVALGYVWPSRLKGILKPHNMVKNCK
jgi:hypothetical protein